MMPTIHAAATDLREGRCTPIDLLDACLERIDRLEPRVHAWVFVDREEARRQAEQLTAEMRRGSYRGRLHGIPLGVKDIIDVFDWPTACGSRLWKQSVARQDAPVVERLRRAGAVLLGKTVTTQYASFDPPPTRNPWLADRTPGGSSSGSAAAVACGMCLGALASQTGGSITRPAAFCGVPSIKPTYGRVPALGVLPLAASMDHVGVMAGCVRDLALLLQCIAGPDPRDPACPRRPVPHYTSLFLAPSAPRLGRLRGFFEERATPAVTNMIDQATEKLRARGATIVEVALPAAFAEVESRHRTVMAVEAAEYHGERLRRHPEDYDPNIRRLLEEGLACPAPVYGRTKEHQRLLAEEMQTCLDGVDALLCPATTSPAPDAATTGDPAFNSPWSYIGFPTVSVPAAWTPEGLPLSIQLLGRPWEEAPLLAVAGWCEQVLEFPRREVK